MYFKKCHYTSGSSPKTPISFSIYFAKYTWGGMKKYLMTGEFAFWQLQN